MPPKKKAPKAVKKKDAVPKAPVGRPRKNLGTRVSDLPLVSTLKPTSRRVNIDSLAMNRARLAYKRDYGKVLDERTSRALIDAMSTTKRGPIGTAVVGTFKRASDAKTTPGYTEHEGFINYYKQALKAAKKNPGNVVTVKKKKDGSLKFEIPGIPEATTSTLDATSVPAPTASSAASTAELRSAADKLLAKNVKLTELINSGTLSADALVEARKKLKANTANLDSVAKGIATSVSPMDDRDLLTQERSRERLRYHDGTLPQAERDAAAARVRQITRQLTNFDLARPIQASEEDIMAAVLGEPEDEEIRRDDPGPSAPATATATAALTAALADPSVSAIVEQVQENAPAIVEQVQENAPVKRAPSARAKSNMLKIAKERKIKKDRQTAADLRARFKAEAEALANAPGRTREQIAADAAERLDQDVRQRDAIAQSERDVGDRILAQSTEERLARRLTKKDKLRQDIRQAMIDRAVEDEIEAMRVRERERQEQELRDQERSVQLSRSDPTSQSFFRGYRTLKQLKKDEDTKNYNERLKNLRAKRDQDIELQNLAELAVQGDQTVSVPSRDRRVRRIVRDNYLDDEFEAEDVDEEDYKELVKRNKAATTIQDSIRSALSRSKLEKQKEASSVLQDAIRRALARNVIPDARRDRQAEADAEFDRLVQEDLDPGPVLISPRRPSNQDAFNRALARSGNIVVPGSSTRQNNRQAPPTKVYGPEAEERVARKVMNYAIDRAGTEMAVTAANRYVDPAALQSQIGRLRKVVPVQDLTQARVIEVRENPARVQEESMLDDFYENLNAKLAAIRKAKGPYVPDEDWDELDPVKTGTGLVGGVIRRLHGMGYFDGYDSLMYNIHGKPDDNKKDLADAKAAYAARGGRMNDDRTDFRVLMDAMKNVRKPTGGAMGGSIVLSGVPAPITGGSDWTLQAVTFPDTDWKTSSSLRWLRSNGIKPMKKADKQGTLFRYRIEDPKKFTDYYTSDLMSRGRKIHLVYGK